MQQSILSYLFPKIGVDLGSHFLRLCTAENARILESSTCVAVNAQDGKVMAFGQEAAEMEGKVGEWIHIRWPVQNGIVSDPDLLKKLLQQLMQKEKLIGFFSSPTVLVSVPVDSTVVQREMVAQVFQSVGCREVLTIAQPLAASIGAGVPIADTSGSLIVHTGSDRMEAALIALGSVVNSETKLKAGRFFEESIANILRENFSLAVSNITVRAIIANGISVKEEYKKKMHIQGKDVRSGKPISVEVSGSIFQPLAVEIADTCSAAINSVLMQVPPELTADIMQKGVLLSGGLAQLRGLAAAVSETVELPVAVIEEPETAVIRGIHTGLQYLGAFKESIGYGN